jgi:hypothetical protein
MTFLPKCLSAGTVRRLWNFRGTGLLKQAICGCLTLIFMNRTEIAIVALGNARMD